MLIFCLSFILPIFSTVLTFADTLQPFDFLCFMIGKTAFIKFIARNSRVRSPAFRRQNSAELRGRGTLKRGLRTRSLRLFSIFENQDQTDDCKNEAEKQYDRAGNDAEHCFFPTCFAVCCHRQDHRNDKNQTAEQNAQNSQNQSYLSKHELFSPEFIFEAILTQNQCFTINFGGRRNVIGINFVDSSNSKTCASDRTSVFG
jgi:hypothetical protein